MLIKKNKKITHVKSSFDLNSIRNSKMNFAYDVYFGAGMNAMKKLLPKNTFLHCDNNPGFLGVSPEPIHRNLLSFLI